MTDLSSFRQIFASTADEEVVWWYFGTVQVEIAGEKPIPSVNPVTIMVYRTETVSPEEVRVHYREVGYFRDPVTGGLVRQWRNPLTGRLVDAATTFVEGPSCYTVRQTADGVRLTLDQAHARIDRLDAVITRHGDRVRLIQNEYKSRGFPLPDGTMSTRLSRAETTLSFFADAADLESGAVSVPSTGTYVFTLDSIPGWMGFGDIAGTTIVTGSVVKADGPRHRLNQEGWETLSRLFPDFFDGDAISPKWS
jgi:hypothetical protein